MDTTYEFHPAANIFPLEDESLESLAEDIKSQGQQCPIELIDEKIVDGRRRYMACRMAGVEPEFVTVKPADPVAYVLSLNLHRRHLSTSQRAMVAARAREFYDKAAKERQKSHGNTAPGKGKTLPENLPELNADARDAAGKAVGVSGKSVDYASRILRAGTPALIKAVESDKISVSTGARAASESPEYQDMLANRAKGTRKAQRYATNGSDEEPEVEEGKSRGVGVQRAHEAIACLKKIPVNDGLRKRGFQIVTDWIKHNK